MNNSDGERVLILSSRIDRIQKLIDRTRKYTRMKPMYSMEIELTLNITHRELKKELTDICYGERKFTSPLDFLQMKSEVKLALELPFVRTEKYTSQLFRDLNLNMILLLIDYAMDN